MTVRPYYQRGDITIYLGDCRDIVPHIGKVDHVITDPPYSWRTHTGGRVLRGGVRKPVRYEIPFDQLADWMPPFVASIPRNRWLLVFCDSHALHVWLDAAGDRRASVIWWRRSDGAPQLSGDCPAVPGEYIVAAHVRGRRRWNGGGHAGYIECAIVKRKGRHPTEKPLPVMQKLLTWFTDPGELILDPFAGSGTTLLAAYSLGRAAIGIEIEERWAEDAARRIESATPPLPIIAEIEAIQQKLPLMHDEENSANDQHAQALDEQPCRAAS